MTLNITINPSELGPKYQQFLDSLRENKVLDRLWDHDHTLWSSNPEEISNRLDWLHLHESMQPTLNELTSFTHELIGSGINSAVLLGMGGSSLAPEVYSHIFGTREGFLDLNILGTTDPMAIRRMQKQTDLTRTVFIVATKSGGTVETLSLFKYFYNQVSALPGQIDAGKQFIAITDPGSKLEQLAAALNFRKIFLNNPNLGGRYSALSYFGLVPAAMIGCDLKKLLASAKEAANSNGPGIRPEGSPAARIGALLAAGALTKRDKLTFHSDLTMNSFSDWVEQLIAESTGKAGHGILPVVGESLRDNLDNYSQDRIFVLQQKGESEELETLSRDLKASRFPAVIISIEDEYDLGGLILTWEMATALAGYLMEIHPFNQPDVESAKVRARESVKAYQKNGVLPVRKTTELSPEHLAEFLKHIQPGDYIGLQAYLPPTPDIEQVFRKIQSKLSEQYNVAVTFGFGPRFLHSTGQLHKGDRGNGHFIQFISRTDNDIDIPDNAGHSRSGISFNTLKEAQALGDGQALTDKQRPLLVFTLDGDLLSKLENFAGGL